MDPRVRAVYKKLLFVSRSYPGTGGYAEAKRRIKSAFLSGKGPIEEAIARGDYMVKELESFVFLHRRGRTRHIACHALLQNAHSIAALGVMGSASGSAAAEGPARALPAPTSTAGAACLPERLQMAFSRVMEGEGFDAGAGSGLVGLRSYYIRVLGCSTQQVDAAVQAAADRMAPSAAINMQSSTIAPAPQLIFDQSTHSGTLTSLDIGTTASAAPIASAIPSSSTSLEGSSSDASINRISLSSSSSQSSLAERLRSYSSSASATGYGREAGDTGIGGGNVQSVHGLQEAQVVPVTWLGQMQVYGVELAACALAALVAACVSGRPRGWAREDLLAVGPSRVAGRGLFATAPISRRTVLGAYPGRLRTSVEMAAKAMSAPDSRGYVFQTSDGCYLDPTDQSGQPSPYPTPGSLWPLPVCVLLSYANEPPKGSGGTNVFVEDGAEASELLFVANRDIFAGEEIFIDYGMTYDRSGYA